MRTSERVSKSYQESPHSELIRQLHVAAYEFAASHVHQRTVLDLGCGTGYGSILLGSYARRVLGVDVSAVAIQEAGQADRPANVSFRQIDDVQKSALPFDDEEFDRVVSFQVIEHLRDPAAYLKEIRRVLSADGILLLTTPNRSVRLFPAQRPWNRFHVTEYSATSLTSLLKSFFPRVEILGFTGELNDLERRRVRRLRVFLLPATLPVLPDVARKAVLTCLSQLHERVSRDTAFAQTIHADSIERTCGWSSSGLDRATELLAVCRLRRH